MILHNFRPLINKYLYSKFLDVDETLATIELEIEKKSNELSQVLIELEIYHYFMISNDKSTTLKDKNPAEAEYFPCSLVIQFPQIFNYMTSDITARKKKFDILEMIMNNDAEKLVKFVSSFPARKKISDALRKYHHKRWSLINKIYDITRNFNEKLLIQKIYELEDGMKIYIIAKRHQHHIIGVLFIFANELGFTIIVMSREFCYHLENYWSWKNDLIARIILNRKLINKYLQEYPSIFIMRIDDTKENLDQRLKQLILRDIFQEWNCYYNKLNLEPYDPLFTEDEVDEIVRVIYNAQKSDSKDHKLISTIRQRN